jgi:hypothetical protein
MFKYIFFLLPLWCAASQRPEGECDENWEYILPVPHASTSLTVDVPDSPEVLVVAATPPQPIPQPSPRQVRCAAFGSLQSIETAHDKEIPAQLIRGGKKDNKSSEQAVAALVPMSKGHTEDVLSDYDEDFYFNGELLRLAGAKESDDDTGLEFTFDELFTFKDETP